MNTIDIIGSNISGFGCRFFTEPINSNYYEKFINAFAQLVFQESEKFQNKN